MLQRVVHQGGDGPSQRGRHPAYDARLPGAGQHQVHRALPGLHVARLDHLRGQGAQVDVLPVQHRPGVGGHQQLLQDLGQGAGAGDHGGHVLGVRLLPARPQPPGQQLGPQAEQRQRRPQLVARVGHEASLHLQRAGERGHRAAGQPRGHQPGEQHADPGGGQQGAQQPLTSLLALLPVLDRLHDQVADPGRADGEGVAGAVAVHDVLAGPAVPGDRGDGGPVGQPRGEAARGAGAALGVDHHQAGARGRAQRDAGLRDGPAQAVVGRGDRRPLVGDVEHRPDHDQDGHDGQAGLHAQPDRGRAGLLVHGSAVAPAGHVDPRRYPKPRTVTTTWSPSLRRR